MTWEKPGNETDRVQKKTIVLRFLGFLLILVLAVPCALVQLRGNPLIGRTTDPDLLRPYLLAVCVKDIDETVKWYKDNLGFSILDKMDFPEYKVKIVLLVLQDFRLEIVEHQEQFSQEYIVSKIPEIKDWDHVFGMKKMAFVVDHLQPVFERLKKNGVKFQAEFMKGQGNWGDSFIVQDNNGNWIQIVEKQKKQNSLSKN